MPTKKKIQESIAEKFEGHRFVVVSNREPYIHSFKDPHRRSGEIECTMPASGLVAALDPIVKTLKGSWVAYAGGDADRKVVDKEGKIKVPPEKPTYDLKRVWINKKDQDGYYYGFANQALWPLCHVSYVRPIFRESDWEAYVRVNRIFADAVLKEIEGTPAMVWFQDYHFALAPQMVKEKRPDVISAHFWHIPWPNPEAFRICPWQKEILEGMLANDLLGFHIRYHCDNFLSTVDQTLEARIDRESSAVVIGGHTTLIKPFPISVDYNQITEDMKTLPFLKASKEEIKKEIGLDYEFIGIGLDRLDYTKGIVERLMAIDRFLEKYPEYQGRFVFLQNGVLSRIHIDQYKALNEKISTLVEKINWKYSEDYWVPIIFLQKHFPYREVLKHYKIGDLCLVSSLHDGMNLVAKEYVSAQDENDPGALILSPFTGSARELTDAFMVNPYDIERFADAIKEALETPKEEKIRRIKNLKAVIQENNIYKWADDFLTEVARLKQQ